MPKKAVKEQPKKEQPKKPKVDKKEDDFVPTSKPVPLLRGMKDLLPAEWKYWHHIFKKAESLAAAYGFKRLDTPALESTVLFNRSLGKTTDIIEKEMFSFVDQGGDKVSLRPEFTASFARAYVDHGMLNYPQPVKLYTIGTLYRHERPQAGRLREHHQFNCEVFGSKHPVIDAELIFLAYNLLSELGVEVNVQINSIGCQECRPEYRERLIAFFKTRKKLLCEDCQRRLTKNPLRILDCKNEQCKSLVQEAPQVLDGLCDECKEHFTNVLEYLEDAAVPYQLNPHLVRGLDYYTKTVFEIWPIAEQERALVALGGGGRYDLLVENLGGRPTPASGFGLGIERIILFMKENNILVPEELKPQIYVAQLGEQAKRKSLELFETLRKHGFRLASNFSKDGLRPQLESANQLGAQYTLILGQKEVLEGTIMIRDMDGGVQEIINFEKVIPEIEKRMEQAKTEKMDASLTDKKEEAESENKDSSDAEKGDNFEGKIDPVI